jgi:putative ABC transport system permease protein
MLSSFPIAYSHMNSWLADYAYAIQLQCWYFATVAMIVVLITFITVSYQTVKAAVANPVDSLKND